MIRRRMMLGSIAIATAFFVIRFTTPAVQSAAAVAATTQATDHVPLVFTGGYDTDPRDRGRPVVLVANGLGVTPEVFRDAFSGVHPAGPNSGGPTPDEARANKRVLLDKLAKYGVTNDRLDEVSNYYRYRRSDGELWKHRAATGYAIIENGKITSVDDHRRRRGLHRAANGYRRFHSRRASDGDSVVLHGPQDERFD